MTTLNTSAQEHLRQLVEAAESIISDQEELKHQLKEKFSEMRAAGFDVSIIRKIIARRKRSQSEVQEEDALLETYMRALGMEGTPMGDWLENEDKAA